MVLGNPHTFLSRLRDGNRVNVNSINEMFIIISGVGTSNVVYDSISMQQKLNTRERPLLYLELRTKVTSSMFLCRRL